MRQYGPKMNPLRCAFGVSAGKFLGFIIYDHDIKIDPKNVESIKKVKAFTPILRLKNDAEFISGAEQQAAFEEIK
jgi:hypothetical protein